MKCTHLDQVRNVAPRTPEGCEECLRTGSRWVHLRLCLSCGHVGCCDNSPNKHATKQQIRQCLVPLLLSTEKFLTWTRATGGPAIVSFSDADLATGPSSFSSAAA